jgi:hypothetical protein
MRGFLDRESAKCAKLDDPRQLSVDLGQAIERMVQRQDGYLIWRGDLLGVIHGHTPDTLAPLICAMTTSVIDEDAAHDLRRDTKEVRAIPPIDLALVDEPDVRLMDQGCWLQGVVGPLTPKLAPGHPAELGVDEWQQLTERSAVAATPIAEQRRDVRRRHQ